MSLDRLSLSTVPIIPFFNDRQLAGATGFIWKRRERFYLITNWHVVSALDLFTERPLAEGAARPNKLRCHFLIRVGQYERELIDVPIRDEDDQPLWLIHPAQERRAIDVVALPLDGEALRTKVTLLPVNELAPGRLAIMIGMDVFILGYPFGSKPPAFPVWKRGSIASEPDLVRLSTGYYLVDTASRPGMSGSPVILRSWSNHILESNLWTTNNDQLPIDRVIGVYSGRLKPEEAQVGIVWHVEYIDEIIDAGKLDT
ncbi:MAG: trypsin-like peptidase domain-containing protein [Alphaproteobacteria bacterium]|nr:trypsin-like peptidase domain-containing protein [Alphaproteobacteria bacterium]MBM3654054.1 trypsin-like peptidase domain-containing protein [Alphaproteobacteria bacterium]